MLNFDYKAAWAALWQKQPPNKTEKATEESDHHDIVKTTFVNWTATLVPFALGILLAISNGYFFAGFKDFSLTDVGTFIAWGSGFAIEAATLAGIFNAALKLKAGDKKGFRASLAVGLLLAFISFTAQYVFLQMELTNGSLTVNDTAVDKMPIFSMLVGVGGFQGHDILFLIRSSAYHVAEFACTFLIASKGMTHAKKLQKQQEDFNFRMAEQQHNMSIMLIQTLSEGMDAMIKNQQKALSGAFVRIQEEMSNPVPRIEGPNMTDVLKLLQAKPQQPTFDIDQLSNALADKLKTEAPVTEKLNVDDLSNALAERAKKAKAQWKPQPQTLSQPNEGPSDTSEH